MAIKFVLVETVIVGDPLYTIASYKQKLLVKRSNSVLPEWEIREIFYKLVGIL
jgi:hypothetical protein